MCKVLLFSNICNESAVLYRKEKMKMKSKCTDNKREKDS